MDDYLRSDAPVVEALDRAWDRSRLSVRTRLGRLRSRIFLLVQCAVAAGVALVGRDRRVPPPVALLRPDRGRRLPRHVLRAAAAQGLRGRHRRGRRRLHGGRVRARRRQRSVADLRRRPRLDGDRDPPRRQPGHRHPVSGAGHRHRCAGRESRPGLRSLDRRAHRRRRRPRRGDRRAPGAAAAAPGRRRRGGAQDRGAAPAAPRRAPTTGTSRGLRRCSPRPAAPSRCCAS